MTERELKWEDRNTVYNTWDARGLTGPRRNLYLDKYPALWGRIEWWEFKDRYAYLEPENCQVYTGTEILGEGCDDACARVGEVCPLDDRLDCESECRYYPRSITDCLSNLTDCNTALCQWGWGSDAP